MRINTRTVAMVGIACLLLVTTIGAIPAGALPVAPKGVQASKSPISIFSVIAPDGKVGGIIIIDTHSGHFVCVCCDHGMVPGTTYLLQYSISGRTGATFIASGVASKNKCLLLTGTLDPSLLKYPGIFFLGLHVI
ncbi:MAG: hypothetical protein ABSD89_04525 [Halobacteriota archaeon]